GALVGQLHPLVLHPVANHFAGLVDCQYVAFLQIVAGTLVENDHVILANLGHTVGHVENQAIDFIFRIAGEEGGGHSPLFGLQQAVTDAHFLAAAGDHQRGDIALGGKHVGVTDFLGVDAEEVATLRIGIGLATAIKAEGGDGFIYITTGIDAIAGTGYHAFRFTADDIGRGFQLLGVIHDASGIQERVDGFQRNGRNGFGHSRGPHGRRQLDGTTLAAVNHQPWLAINVHQRYDVAGVDEVGVVDLRVGVPDFRPLPGQIEKPTSNIPQGIASDYLVTLGVVFPEHRLLGLHQNAHREQQQAE